MSAATSTALIYTRQSVTDFDGDGRPRGPSLDQQLDAVKRRPEFERLAIEHFQDADRSGKETSRRPGYLAMIERISNSLPGEIAAVGFYDQDRLHRNDLEFFRFMADMEERSIAVYDANDLISTDDRRLTWKVKAIVADEERRKVARRVKDNLAFLKQQGRLLGTASQLATSATPPARSSSTRSRPRSSARSSTAMSQAPTHSAASRSS